MSAIAQTLVRAIIPVIAGRVVKEFDRPLPATAVYELEREVAEAVERDPELKNELNQEHPIQSRVAWGAVIASIGVVGPMIARLFGLDITQDQIVEIGGAITTLFGTAYVMYGRFASFTGPLFKRWFD